MSTRQTLTQTLADRLREYSDGDKSLMVIWCLVGIGAVVVSAGIVAMIADGVWWAVTHEPVWTAIIGTAAAATVTFCANLIMLASRKDPKDDDSLR